MAGMILFIIALILFTRVYLLVAKFVDAMWIRCCWWTLALLVVLFLCGYALFFHFLLTEQSPILDHEMVIALVFFWGSVFVLLSSWLFYSTLRQRNRIEDELLQTTRQLLQSRKTEAIGRLAGGVAHDFNNVLTVIMGYAEVSLHYSAENPNLVESLKMIKEGAERGRGMTDQLLAFCRRQTVEYHNIAMEEVLNKSLRMLNQLIPENIVLKVKSSCPGWVSGAADQIELILMNLILNARDAMPAGGQISITVSSEDATRTADGTYPETGRHVVLTIADTGEGMDQETSSMIFDPYFTTKEHGTGLGLSMVSGTVAQHGGQITVASTPGEGTVFRLSLPEVNPATEEMPASSDTIQASAGSPVSQKTVLIVDDDERIRRLTVMVLRDSGYYVLEAGTGAEALYQCDHSKSPIHLLLTDVAMPNMDGPELVKLIQRVYPEIQVFFMSGYPQHEAGIDEFIAGGSQFLSKPFTPAKLQEMVGQVFEQ